jgi:FKBP-type peptidyl-prolyl cis-trans isomerase 2
MSKVEIGQTVSVHYVGTLDDGTEFDSSRKNNEPLLCEVGGGKLIKGFDSALIGMQVGDVKKVSVDSDNAYGDIIEEAFQTVSKSAFPEDFAFNVGETVRGNNENGQPVRAKIESLNESDVTLNFNHPMAGQNLNFEIELLEIK